MPYFTFPLISKCTGSFTYDDCDILLYQKRDIFTIWKKDIVIYVYKWRNKCAYFLLIWRSKLVHAFSEDSASCSVKLSVLDGIRSLEIKGKFFGVLYYYSVEWRGEVWHIVEWKLQTLNL